MNFLSPYATLQFNYIAQRGARFDSMFSSRDIRLHNVQLISLHPFVFSTRYSGRSFQARYTLLSHMCHRYYARCQRKLSIWIKGGSRQPKVTSFIIV